jgi:hypothetical protein
MRPTIIICTWLRVSIHRQRTLLLLQQCALSRWSNPETLRSEHTVMFQRRVNSGWFKPESLWSG